MRSAVAAWADAHEAGLAHEADKAHGPRSTRGRNRYKPMCACCAPEEAHTHAGKPQLRQTVRPVLAWRTRLAELQAPNAAFDA